MQIDVAMCTFQRESVVDTIASVGAQELPEGVTLRILVADNDVTPSAQERVETAAKGLRWPVVYIHAPAGNISIARNACLDHADADWLAFVDDDEVAHHDWLANALAAAKHEQADIVFGPTIARYPAVTPDWIRSNNFHTSLATHRNGQVETGHAGNVLMRFRGTPAQTTRFDLDLGQSGGEDTDFFFRLFQAGMVLTICDAAVVEEDVHPTRLRLRWLIDRRFAEGTHYGSSAPGLRVVRFGKAFVKAGYCGLRTLAAFTDRGAVAFWFLRAVFHCGVCVGTITRPRRVAYGLN